MTGQSGRTTIVVPCYNEELRLDIATYRGLAESGGLSLLFVDDGSGDATGSIVTALAVECDGIHALVLPHNVGKAEAVRLGMVAALEEGASIVGYCDADLATPADELLRLVRTLEDDDVDAVFGSRVARLGSSIDRSNFRHYSGRVFASLASWSVGVVVYDTQCGAKVFRATPALDAALAEPFRSPWGFDVRLLSRLLQGNEAVPGMPPESFVEMPLKEWRDVKGSKLDIRGSIRAFADVLTLGIERLSR